MFPVVVSIVSIFLTPKRLILITHPTLFHSSLVYTESILNCKKYKPPKRLLHTFPAKTQFIDTVEVNRPLFPVFLGLLLSQTPIQALYVLTLIFKDLKNLPLVL